MFDAWKQRQRQRLENRPERTVFYNIFATMMLVLAVELLMAVASILAINVTGQLDENAKDLLTMRVRNRASYVQEILRNAEDLEQLSEQITATTQQLLKSGDISLDTLDNSSEQSDALLVALAPQLFECCVQFFGEPFKCHAIIPSKRWLPRGSGPPARSAGDPHTGGS